MPAVLSIMTNSYGRFGPRAALELLKDTGLSSIELPIRSPGQVTVFKEPPLVTTGMSAAELVAVDRLLEQFGIRVTSCNVTGGNPLNDVDTEAILKRLEVAARFDVPLVVGPAGEVDNRSQLPELYENLLRIGDKAGDLGMTYCFETHPGICQSHPLMLETMQALNHPHLKLNFDTANILYYNENVDGEVALAKVCHHVRHLHLKDSHGEYRQWTFPALGYGGAVDFVRVRQIMRDCGFEGAYSIEVEGIEGEPPLTLEQMHRRVVDSVEHLRGCGFFDDCA